MGFINKAEGNDVNYIVFCGAFSSPFLVLYLLKNYNNPTNLKRVRITINTAVTRRTYGPFQRIPTLIGDSPTIPDTAITFAAEGEIEIPIAQLIANTRAK
jgi:hypothetical protein